MFTIADGNFVVVVVVVECRAGDNLQLHQAVAEEDAGLFEEGIRLGVPSGQLQSARRVVQGRNQDRI